MIHEQYAAAITEFAIYPDAGNQTDVEKAYLCLGLASEAGEVASLMKKEMRDLVDFEREKWMSELGDVLWYMTRLMDFYGIALEDLMLHNIAKLNDRKQRNKLTGSGDTR